MRFFLKLLLVLFALALFTVGYRFASDNSGLVALSWGLVHSPELPIFIWLATFLLAGFLLGLLVLALALLRMSLRLRNLRRDLERLKMETSTPRT